MVFASPSGQFYRDGTTSYLLPGFSHLDNFIWTRKLAFVNRDFAKTHASPDPDGNFPYHRAVIMHYHSSRSFGLSSELIDYQKEIYLTL
jgi:hypothetical protein